MAKLFNPSVLPAQDQAAYNNWKAQAQQYLQGGSLPAELSYALAHPEYLKQHPELQDAYNTLTGANLPPSVKAAVQQQLGGNTNFDWSGGQAGIAKHKGVWSQPETWIQLALAGTVGGAAAGGAFAGSGGGAAAGAAPTAAPTLGGVAGGIPVTTGMPAGLTAAGGTTAGSAATTGILPTINKYFDKMAPLIGAAGSAVAGASQAAANNRYLNDQYGLDVARMRQDYDQQGLQGYNANTAAQSAFQNQIQSLAALEASQRKTGLSNIYKQSVAQNPSKSPYNTGNVPTISNAYMTAIGNLANQASGQLAAPPKYDAATGIPTPTYNPYVQPPWMPPTQTQPGAGEKVGNWLGPVLAGIGGYYTMLHQPPPAKK